MAAAGLLLAAAGAQAAPFVFNDNDLLLTFHRTGSPDFEVNIGSALTYASATSSFAVGGYTASQISSIFGNTDGLSWSVMGGVRPGGGNASTPANTLWLTRARTDASVATLSYDRKSSSTQGAISSTINGIAGNGSIAGAVPWSSGTTANPVSNTSTAVSIPSGDPNSYTQLAGQLGNLNGSFSQSGLENTVPAGGLPTSSDLYEILPGTGKSIYLGRFDMGQNGTLLFTPVPEPGTMALLGLGGLLFLARRARPSDKQTD